MIQRLFDDATIAMSPLLHLLSTMSPIETFPGRENESSHHVYAEQTPAGHSMISNILASVMRKLSRNGLTMRRDAHG